MRRWVTEHVYANAEREALQTVIVYPVNESEEVVKKENGKRKYKRELIHLNK